MTRSRFVAIRAMRIAFSLASVPELQKKVLVRAPGAMETSFFAQRVHDVPVTMSGAGDSMTAVEIEIPLAVARVDPDPITAFSRDGHLFVSGELKLIFVCHRRKKLAADNADKIRILSASSAAGFMD